MKNETKTMIAEFVIILTIVGLFGACLIGADYLEKEAGISGCSSETILAGRCI